MTIDLLRQVLGWCSIINMALLLWWFLFLVFAHDFVYRIHSRLFRIPVESFNSIHYAGIVFFKLIVLVFNVVPYFALKIVG